jgi:hypothetical protein
VRANKRLMLSGPDKHLFFGDGRLAGGANASAPLRRGTRRPLSAIKAGSIAASPLGCMSCRIGSASFLVLFAALIFGCPDGTSGDGRPPADAVDSFDGTVQCSSDANTLLLDAVVSEAETPCDSVDIPAQFVARVTVAKIITVGCPPEWIPVVENGTTVGLGYGTPMNLKPGEWVRISGPLGYVCTESPDAGVLDAGPTDAPTSACPWWIIGCQHWSFSGSVERLN